MNELFSRFDAIKSRADIDKIIEQSSSSDGEDSRFEMKGTSGKTEIQRDEKKLFAKEISAFANTYGGILCIHKGKDVEIQSFELLEATSLHNRIETWLRDSLEPRLQGMILKECDGLFLIFIPESRTKPHRSAVPPEKNYYYRHNTQSETMSELMISAMYRSQDYLSTSALISLGKSDTQKLDLGLVINNESMIAGTKPRATIQIFSCQQGRFKPDFCGNRVEFEELLGEHFTRPNVFSPTLGIHPNCQIRTPDKFQDFILYPKDKFILSCELSPYSPFDTKSVRFFMVRLDYFFLETTPQVKYFLIDAEPKLSGDNSSTKVIATGLEDDKIEIVTKYIAAISAHQNKISP
jgi:hypothetical protein